MGRSFWDESEAATDKEQIAIQSLGFLFLNYKVVERIRLCRIVERPYHSLIPPLSPSPNDKYDVVGYSLPCGSCDAGKYFRLYSVLKLIVCLSGTGGVLVF